MPKRDGLGWPSYEEIAFAKLRGTVIISIEFPTEPEASATDGFSVADASGSDRTVIRIAPLVDSGCPGV